MPVIYLQESLTFQEKEFLRQEFPHYRFYEHCKSDEWGEVEILFGNELSEKELKHATHLRWIHCPSSETEGLCLEEIQKRENILISLSRGDNVLQIAEFVMSALLCFAKQLIAWSQIDPDPEKLWQSSLRESQWTLNRRVLLQVGLGEVGTAVVKHALEFEMNTWGVRRQSSFHPYCQKTFSPESLHSLLPAADVVVLAFPKGTKDKLFFGSREFQLMKQDSIFIAVGTGEEFDEQALANIAHQGKFRGILIDAFQPETPPKNSPLWGLPNTVLTPGIASFPHSMDHSPFKVFRRNLRLFTSGKIDEMKNLVLTK